MARILMRADQINKARILQPANKENLTEDTGFFSNLRKNIANPTLTGFFRGASKTIGQQFLGLGKMAEDVKQSLPGAQFRSRALPTETTEALKIKGEAEGAGKTATELSELFVGPEVAGETGLGLLGEVSPELGRGISLAARASRLGVSSLANAVDFAARTFLQTGGDVKKSAEAGGTGFLGNIAVSGAQKFAPHLGNVVAAVVGEMIGKDSEIVKKAFSDPVEIAERISQKIIPYGVRQKAIKALNLFETSFKDEFSKGLKNIKNLYPFGKTGKILVKQDVENLLTAIPRIFRNFRVAVEEGGASLNFDKLNSAIVKSGEQSNLQKVWNTIGNQTNFSVQGFQDVAARINALSKFTEGAKTESSAIIAQIHNAYSEAIEKVYPELGKLRNNYAMSTQIYKEIDSILKSGAEKAGKASTITSAVKSLINSFNENNEAYLMAIKKLEEVSGVDLIKDLVASEFRGGQRKVGSIIMQAGVIAGGTHNPLALLALPLFFPSVAGRYITRAGKMAPTIGKLFPSLPRVIPPFLPESKKEESKQSFLSPLQR